MEHFVKKRILLILIELADLLNAARPTKLNTKNRMALFVQKNNV